MRKLAIIALIGCLEAGEAAGQDSLSNSLVSARASVARIEASECQGGARSRIGSGFLWRDGRTLVTARHVVAGCRRVGAFFTTTGKSHKATPERELKAQDLVLMRLDPASGSQPLEEGQDLPPVGARVGALGFAYGMPTLDSKMLEVTVANAPPGSRLKDLLSDSLLASLRQSGEIDEQTAILRLDGNLLPGHSGAPLIGADNVVYGIGSGGLQEGAGGVVWAVRASYLKDLADAPAVKAVAPVAASGLAFAVQTPQEAIDSALCGDSLFMRSRRLSLADLSMGSDDPLGLRQIAATVGLADADASGLEYDVWVDEASGAALAVPADVALEQDTGDTCRATIADGIEIVVAAVAVDGGDVQGASLQFEQALAAEFSLALMPDPAFTYPAPTGRSDGFVVRRRAYGMVVSAGGSLMQSDYAFITHMTRGDRYVGVGAVRRDFFMDGAAMQMCQMGQLQFCADLQSQMRPWGKTALAVHLATIPPI